MSLQALKTSFCTFALSIALFPLLSFAVTQDSTDPIEVGLSAYQDGEYREAADFFEAAIERGEENSALYLALGNCHYRLEQYGRARFYYRMALKFSPNDNETLWNLKLTREKIGIDAPQNLHWSSSILFLQSRLSDDQNRLLILFATMISCLLIGLRVYNKSPVSNLASNSCVIATLALATLFAFSQRTTNGELELCFLKECRVPIRAIIASKEVSVRAGPGEAFQVVSVVKDGFDFEVLDRSDNWVQIRLPNKRVAWAPDERVKILD